MNLSNPWELLLSIFGWALVALLLYLVVSTAILALVNQLRHAERKRSMSVHPASGVPTDDLVLELGKDVSKEKYKTDMIFGEMKKAAFNDGVKYALEAKGKGRPDAK